MLLLGGKNLVPLVSAAVIQSLGWRWVFIIVAIIVAAMFVLTYLCVPETCWDRTPVPAARTPVREPRTKEEEEEEKSEGALPSSRVRFAEDVETRGGEEGRPTDQFRRTKSESHILNPPRHTMVSLPATPSRSLDHRSHPGISRSRSSHSLRRIERQEFAFHVPLQDVEPVPSPTPDEPHPPTYRFRKKNSRELLKVYQGRLSTTKWWKNALKPFILITYPAIAFVPPPPPSARKVLIQATLLYSLSVVWLIVLSEVVAQIFQAEFPSILCTQLT
jgi:hypothetical protein